ncbi:helix-turn-helix domain-containing protein [Shewanella sp. TC10]|uniref:helix-turn-helix domain-containing protein n=1 Tax=Shewanella sp. TC10 TaxID=1419739 RepID=UPI00129D8523|nr:helix-turn-helix domain-containing protein [Shewanella sp. TC10]
MIYKVRPASSVKMVLASCDANKFSLPECFNRFKCLGDKELISMKSGNELLDFIENNTDNPYFFLDFSEGLIDNWLRIIGKDFETCASQAEILFRYFQIYTHRLANYDWRLVEESDSLMLIANRGLEFVSSKFDDLILYGSLISVMKNRGFYGSVEAGLPFGREYYGRNLALFENVTFDKKHLYIKVNKSQGEVDFINKIQREPSIITEYEQVIAATNMIDVSVLSLESLSFVLGMSSRQLQRTLKAKDLYVKDIIRDARFRRAVNILERNQGDLKRTYLECGFKHQSQLSHLFNKASGLSPLEYTRKHFKHI